MTDAAVISGTLSDVRTVKTRKVVQVVIEVPMEQLKSVYDALGYDLSGASWVALARLKEEPKASPEQAPKIARNWSDMSRAQQAGIRCNEQRFWEFCKAQDVGGAAKYVRSCCGVVSRADLDTGSDAGAAWDSLESSYQTWLRYGDDPNGRAAA